MIRTIKLFFTVMILCIGFTACEKEYSLESGGLPGGASNGGQTGTAVFTLTGTPGACTTPIISGNYIVGTPMDASNSIILIVDVTTVGTYTVYTGTSNGISFSGSGTFTITGSQIIILTGTGTPAAAGIFYYGAGLNGCSFPITTTTGSASNAAGTLDCSTATLAGTYTQSIALSSSNTITIPVTVTTAGAYSITTTSTNGVTFSGSGNLALGAHSIVLTGTGTPTNAGAVSIPVSLGTSNCSVSITFLPAPPPAVFTLEGAPGTCTSASIAGTYTAGTALSSTNTVTVSVNVTTAGVYTITTNTVNGMTFSKTGLFTSTGTGQSVILVGSGTPTAAGTNTFTVGTAGCTFDVVVTAPTSPCTGLVADRFVMAGQFTLNGFSFGASLGSTYQISIQQGAVTLDVIFPGGSAPAPGTYSVPTVSMSCLNSDFTTWTGNSGSVYVSEVGGNTIVEFCNVAFTGVPITGGSISSTGQARMEP